MFSRAILTTTLGQVDTKKTLEGAWLEQQIFQWSGKVPMITEINRVNAKAAWSGYPGQFMKGP